VDSEQFKKDNNRFWGISGRSQLASNAASRHAPGSQRATLASSGHANAEIAKNSSSHAQRNGAS